MDLIASFHARPGVCCVCRLLLGEYSLVHVCLCGFGETMFDIWVCAFVGHIIRHDACVCDLVGVHKVVRV